MRCSNIVILLALFSIAGCGASPERRAAVAEQREMQQRAFRESQERLNNDSARLEAGTLGTQSDLNDLKSELLHPSPPPRSLRLLSVFRVSDYSTGKQWCSLRAYSLWGESLHLVQPDKEKLHLIVAESVITPEGEKIALRMTFGADPAGYPRVMDVEASSDGTSVVAQISDMTQFFSLAQLAGTIYLAQVRPATNLVTFDVGRFGLKGIDEALPVLQQCADDIPPS